MVVQLCLFACAAAALLFLPGFSLLRVCAPRLDLVSRIVLAPGVTIAVATLLFLWAEVFSLKLGWPIPWIVLGLSLLAFVQRRPHLPSLHGDWLGCVVLAALFLLLLVVRFYSTRDWIVPPRSRFRPACDHCSTAARSPRAVSIVGALQRQRDFYISFWLPRHHRAFRLDDRRRRVVRRVDHGARDRRLCGPLRIWAGATLDALSLGRRLRGRSLGDCTRNIFIFTTSRGAGSSWRVHCFVERLGFARVVAVSARSQNELAAAIALRSYHRRPCPHSI